MRTDYGRWVRARAWATNDAARDADQRAARARAVALAETWNGPTFSGLPRTPSTPQALNQLPPETPRQRRRYHLAYALVALVVVLFLTSVAAVLGRPA